MTDEKFDLILRDCIAEISRRYAEKFDAIDVTGIADDPSLEKRFYRIMKYRGMSAAKRRARIISVRIAAAVIILLTLLTVTIIAVKPFRDAVWNTVVKWREDYVSVSYVATPAAEAQTPTEQQEFSEPDAEANNTPTGNENVTPDGTTETQPVVTPPKEILEYKKPTGLPDNVEEEQVVKNKIKYVIDYYIGNDLYMSYYQSVLNANEISFDDTDVNMKKTYINGNEYIILTYTDTTKKNAIIWNDGMYDYYISSMVSENELIFFASTVK